MALKTCKLLAQLRLLRQLHTTVLGSIKSKQIDDSFLTSSALLLQKVPDIYTVWNARRAALETLLQVCWVVHTCVKANA